MPPIRPLNYGRRPPPKVRGAYWFTDRLGCLLLTAMLAPIAALVLTHVRRVPYLPYLLPGPGAPLGRTEQMIVSTLIVSLATLGCLAVVGLVGLLRAQWRAYRATRKGYEVDRPTSGT